MKRILPIIVFLCASLPGRSNTFAQSTKGVSVWGKVLHLHQDAQVGVRGDLHLQEAAIGGQG